ncbi:endonuclease III domain-containing protein [Candidatus Undinarchaeota archaeon]
MDRVSTIIKILDARYKKKLALDYVSDPFDILISTIISQRTKDEVTIETTHRLLKKFPTPKKLAAASEKQIAELIYPAGFYRQKSPKIKAVAEHVSKNGVPDTIDGLLELPGVGRKTANCVLSYGFKKQVIAVDTHVHRISNRLGWVKTKNPDQTEFDLQKIVPKAKWRLVNSLLVSFGQEICKPIHPKCLECPIKSLCPSAKSSTSD